MTIWALNGNNYVYIIIIIINNKLIKLLVTTFQLYNTSITSFLVKTTSIPEIQDIFYCFTVPKRPMITYTYLCSECGEIELQQRISDSALQECPDCGSGNFRKMIKVSNFSLKGSGWAGKDSKADSLFQARID